VHRRTLVIRRLHP